VVVALHEFEQAIRWACARHDTPVFELKGMTTRSCAACGALGLAAVHAALQQVLCAHCGAQHERQANAACCAWRWVHEGLDERVRAHRTQAEGQIEQTKARIEARKLGVADKRRAGRLHSASEPQGGHEGPV
jgi:transposase